MNSFGKRLSAALSARNMSQKELAERLNSTTATISRYVTGKRLPDAEYVRRIAKELDISSDYLLGLTDNPSEALPTGIAQDELTDKLYRYINMELQGLPEEELEKILDYMQYIKSKAEKKRSTD